MGGDGGSIPRREELVRSKKKPEQAERMVANAALWRHCALSQDRLQPPIVSCLLGRLYNKESIINKLLNRITLTNAADHIKKLKDVRELRLTVNPRTNSTDPLNDASGEFYCSITGLEMSGIHPFVYLWTCGCVFSKKALSFEHENRCMRCGKPFTDDDVILLNPQTDEEMAAARRRLAKNRSSQPKTKAKKRSLPNGHTEDSAKKKSESQVDEQTAPEESKVEESTEEPQPSTSDAVPVKIYKSIQEDPHASSVYKSLFNTSEQAKRQPKAHWVTYNPLYFR